MALTKSNFTKSLLWDDNPLDLHFSISKLTTLKSLLVKNADSRGQLQTYLISSSGIWSFNSSPGSSYMPWSLRSTAIDHHILWVTPIITEPSQKHWTQIPKLGLRLPCRPSSLVKSPVSLLLHTLLVSLKKEYTQKNTSAPVKNKVLFVLLVFNSKDLRFP